MAQPVSVPSDGMLKVAWVPAIANTASPTAAELTAVSVVDLSCYLTADGYTPSQSQDDITDDRLCSQQTFAKGGRIKYALDLKYIYNPTSAPDNKAYSTLVPRTNGFVVTRWGLDYSAAFAAAQKVDVIPMECGAQLKGAPEANSVLKVMQSLRPIGDAQLDKTVV